MCLGELDMNVSLASWLGGLGGVVKRLGSIVSRRYVRTWHAIEAIGSWAHTLWAQCRMEYVSLPLVNVSEALTYGLAEWWLVLCWRRIFLGDFRLPGKMINPVNIYDIICEQVVHDYSCFLYVCSYNCERVPLNVNLLFTSKWDSKTHQSYVY